MEPYRMNYERINNLTGWGVFLVALIVYLLTVAPTASFWDCGEFIACSNELEVTHPPGAPLFLILGRIFSMFAFGDVTKVAFMVNLMSVLSSAFTALFTCWTVTILARKGLKNSDMPDQMKLVGGMMAGAIAGLSCVFADSIWFNAVEAEVYAMSTFFTAIVVWLMFKWEARADEPGHWRWIVLIAYLMGLSTGVHLLNLLTIPALATVFYLRKFSFTWKGLIAALGISVVILAFIQYGIIQYTFSIAWEFEKLFTGTTASAGESGGGMGLPMGTGATIFGLLILGTLIGSLLYSIRKRLVILNVVVLSVMMIMIGFSSYSIIFIRSGVDSPIDMNNPENLLTFLSYMRREQYGDRPLLKGPLYNGQIDRDARGYPKFEVTGMKYIKLDGVDQYVEDTENRKYKYRDRDIVWFPRMYESSRPSSYSGPFGYKSFVKRRGSDADNPADDRPTRGEDIKFFLGYQLNHMYFRYFMWNFVGRVSDVQDADWEGGILRRTETRNKGNNHYYYLPFFLGILGFLWQFVNNKRDAAIIGMLFFFTGIAIILYLNQYPVQPRERDYSYAGSFQTFCMWIGLGSLFLMDLMRVWLKKATPYVVGAICLTAPLLMATENWDDHTRRGRYIDKQFAYNLLNSCEKDAILFTGGDNDTFPLWYIQEVEGVRTDVRVVNLELLISDWYIDQMQHEKNGASALPITMNKRDYVGDKSIIVQPYASRKITFPVNPQALKESGVFSEKETQLAENEMEWDFKARGSSRNSYIFRKDSVIINMLRNIANDDWKRPVYFANTMNPSSFMNLVDFFRMEGFAYRVLPLKKSDETANDMYYGRIGQERMYDNLLNKFLYDGLNDPSVSFDEHIRGVIIGNYRNSFFRLSRSYGEQIRKLNERNSSIDLFLSTQANAAPTLLDSLRQEKIDNTNVVAAKQEKIRTLMTFAEEKIPHTIIPREMQLLIMQGQMLDRAGLEDMAEAEFNRAKDEGLRALRIKIEAGKKLAERDVSLNGCLYAIQFLMSKGKVEEANTIAEAIQTLTGRDDGLLFMQEMQGR